MVPNPNRTGSHLALLGFLGWVTALSLVPQGTSTRGVSQIDNQEPTAALTAQTAPQTSLLAFYPLADALIKNPPEEKKMRVISQTKVKDVYVTFMGHEKEKALIALFTKDKPDRPEKHIWLKARYNPTATSGSVRGWAYIYDRNGDGKIDYMALLSGALAVKKPDFPATFSKTDEVSWEEIKLLISCGQLIFRHLADDDFDGKFDHGVFDVMDPERPMWVEGWLYAGTARTPQTQDEGWIFRDKISEKTGEPKRDGGKIRLSHAGLAPSETKYVGDFLQGLTASLTSVNEAAQQCNLSASAFYSQPALK